jgi:hypothetical protein
MGKMSERFGQNEPSLTEKFPIDVQLSPFNTLINNLNCRSLANKNAFSI